MSRHDIYVLLVLLGALTVFVGSSLPLVEASVTVTTLDKAGNPVQEVRSRDLTSFSLGWLGNGLLAAAAAGVVCLVTGSARGVVAVGAGVLVLMFPVPWQLDLPTSDVKGGSGATALRAQVGDDRAALSFGWGAWCTVSVGALLFIGGGISKLRTGGGTVAPTADPRAEPSAVSTPAT